MRSNSYPLSSQLRYNGIKLFPFLKNLASLYVPSRIKNLWFGVHNISLPLSILTLHIFFVILVTLEFLAFPATISPLERQEYIQKYSSPLKSLASSSSVLSVPPNKDTFVSPERHPLPIPVMMSFFLHHCINSQTIRKYLSNPSSHIRSYSSASLSLYFACLPFLPNLSANPSVASLRSNSDSLTSLNSGTRGSSTASFSILKFLHLSTISCVLSKASFTIFLDI